MNDPNSNDPNFHAPIPTPDGRVASEPLPSVNHGDWQSAPPVVRSWAYTLALLGMLGSILLVLAGFFSPELLDGRVGFIVMGFVLFGISLWMRKAIRQGVPAAWTVQIILSALGVFSFPIGTLIHGYVLFHWFKPETKAWFQKP
jgi:hypothetical protein